MKNWIKGAISYAVIVGVPICAFVGTVSGVSKTAYKEGYRDGKVDGLNTATVLGEAILNNKKEDEE